MISWFPFYMEKRIFYITCSLNPQEDHSAARIHNDLIKAIETQFGDTEITKHSDSHLLDE